MTLRSTKMLQLLHRPLLIEAKAAHAVAAELRDLDGRIFGRPSRFDALMRKVGLASDRKVQDRPSAFAPLWAGPPSKRLAWGGCVVDGIALMQIEGELLEHGGPVGECGEWYDGYDTIACAIAEADADPDVKGILVRFDTPGGVVASGIYDLATKLQARGADAKPLWAQCETACSAGYWIASQFDRVLAPAAGRVGSIGVVIGHEDVSGALERIGIKFTTIEAPKDGLKTAMGDWKPLSEEAIAIMQSDIDELMQAFAATVQAGRGDKLTAEKAIALRAGVFPAVHSDKARDAQALGLIDGVMSDADAFAALKAQLAASSTLTIPAPAGSPAATAASTTETTMSRKTRIDAVMAGKTSAKTDSEKLEEIRKIMDEPADDGEEEPAEDDGEEDPAAEVDDEEDDAEATAPAPKPAAASTPKTPNAKTVLAIMDLPEAQGREKQARKLAETPGMTAEMAKGILAAGAVARPSRLANATQVNVTADGGVDERTDSQKAVAVAALNAGIVVE